MSGPDHTEESPDSMPPRSTPRLLAAAALSALALTSGCGDQPTTQTATGSLQTMFEHDFYFDPQVLHAEPGTLTLQIVNRGRIPHNFRLERAGREVGRTSALKPGGSARVTVKLTRGDYHYFCSVGNHEELGLYGTLVVR
jgi:plastocyanin